MKFGVVAFSKLEGQGAGAAGDRFSGLETDTTPSGDGEQDESGAISASNKIASTRYKVQLFQDRILTDVRIRI